MNTYRLHVFTKSFVLGMTLCFAAIAGADDTEIFFGNAANTGDTLPNIMFVLDTSGSMSKRDGYSQNRLERMKEAVVDMLNEDRDMNIGLMQYNGWSGGGPVLYPITNLPKLTCTGGDCSFASGPQANDYEVDGELGDVEESVSTGAITTDSTELNMVLDENSLSNVIGLRFSELNIARKTSILEARIELVAAGDQIEDSTMIIEIEDIDHAQPYDNTSNSVTNRTYDSEEKEWIPDEWYDKATYQTEDIADMLQKVIDRDDWCVDNSVAFKISGTENTRIAYSHEKAIADGVDYIPKLRIILDPVTAVDDTGCGNYVSSTRIAKGSDDAEQWVGGAYFLYYGSILDTGMRSGGDTRQALGLRFGDIGIPKDSEIESAFVRMTMQRASTGTLSGDWFVEDSTQPETYLTPADGPANRTYLTERAPWNDISTAAVNETIESDDIAPLIQAMVDKDEWDESDPDNAIALNFVPSSGTGQRDYKSFELSATQAPELVVTYSPPPIDAQPAYTETIVNTLSARYDDAEQDADESSFGDSSSDLDLQYRSSNAERLVGLRFQSVDIPKDATIDSAHIELAAASTDSGNVPLAIHIEDSVNNVRYDSSSVGPAMRSYLSTSVPWTITKVLDEPQKYTTPDISSLLQLLVNKPEWDQNNNAIGFKLHPTYNAANNKRDFISHDGDDDETAELHVTYTVAAVAGTPPPGTGPGSAKPAYSGTSTGPSVNSRQARDDMIKIVNDLEAHSGTPTVDTFYEAARYMRGETVDFGKRRGNPSKRSYRTDPRFFRISHEDSYTGGFVSRSSQCIEGNMSSSKCSSENITGNPTYISPIKGACQGNHIVLLSDGETNGDIKSPIKALSMIPDRNTCSTSGNGACGTDLAKYLHENDQVTGFGALPGNQTITTHTIAYNLGGTGKNFLKTVAAAGGGTAYEAASASDLLGVFNELVSTIVDVDTGFTAPAATVNQFNRLTHRDDLYFAVFKPEDTAAWKGNIKRFRLGKDSEGEGDVVIRDYNGSAAINQNTGYFKDTAQSWWPELDNAGVKVGADGNEVERGGAANQLTNKTTTAGANARNVYTWLNPVGTQILKTQPIDLTASDQKFHETNTLITDAILDIEGKKSSATEQSAYKTKLLKWARGVDVDDSDKDNSTTDMRRHMGDPMHSRPLIVNYADSSATDDVRSLLFVGTNEGFLHAIDTSDGNEEFAYIPYELLGNLDTFYENSAGFDRPYGLDGLISVWKDDVNDNGIIDTGDSAYLFVGMRRGGSHYYALNITDPDQPKLVWTIKGGTGGTAGFTHLGQSWSRMTPVKMYINDTAEDVLVFGGGYDTNQDKSDVPTLSLSLSRPTDDVGNGIYIVRATDGVLLWSGKKQTDGSESFSAMDYGFASNIRTIDINRDGYIDQMYAADTGGQIWRFDVTQNHASSSSDDLIDGGVIASIGGAGESNHRRFYNEPDVALIETDDETFLSVSIGSGWRAHPLDEATNDRFYMIKQYSIYEKPEGYGREGFSSDYSPIEEWRLENVTYTATPLGNKYGWYLDLQKQGEKVLGTSVTFGSKIIFTSYVPTTQVEVCTAESGSGRAYVLDAATGAPGANLDQTPDSFTNEVSKVLTTSDRSTELSRSGIPPEAMVMLSKDSPNSPQILIGGEQLETGITNSTRRTFWSDEGESGEIVADESEDGDSGTEVSESDQGG